jgi:plasmid stabilization system protein ParE
MLSVKIFRRAARQIQEAASWWIEHRPKAPNAFKEEFERCLTLISQEPRIGAKAANAKLAGVRRVYLERIRYHLYYRVRPTHIEVLALWHSSRGSEPDL